MRGGALTLFQTSLGAGVLTLPHMATIAGLGVEIIILLATGFQLFWVTYMLGRISVNTKSKLYPEIMTKVLGDTNGVKILV